MSLDQGRFLLLNVRWQNWEILPRGKSRRTSKTMNYNIAIKFNTNMNIILMNRNLYVYLLWWWLLKAKIWNSSQIYFFDNLFMFTVNDVCHVLSARADEFVSATILTRCSLQGGRKGKKCVKCCWYLTATSCGFTASKALFPRTCCSLWDLFIFANLGPRSLLSI